MTEPLTSNEHEIEKLVDYWDKQPTILSQTPIEFENGAVLDSYRGRCKVCNQPIDDDLLHGAVARPTSTVAVVTAVGLCVPCKTITEFDHRFRDDLSMEWIDEKGKWVRRLPRPGLKTRLLKLIGKDGAEYH